MAAKLVALTVLKMAVLLALMSADS
jgi:hypothetical protein